MELIFGYDMITYNGPLPNCLNPKYIDTIYEGSNYDYNKSHHYFHNKWGVDYCVFDVAVNSGPTKAIKLLQNAVGTPQTGQISDRDVQLANNADLQDLITKICNERLVFLQSLNTWATFGKGWSNRVAYVQRTALKMLA